MEHIYAVTSEKELAAYQAFAVQAGPRLRDYADFLEKEYSVCNLPNAIVWTSGAVATNLISNIPIPAYTNDFRVVITPDIEAWQSIYLSQLDTLGNDEICRDIRSYYHHSLSQNHILQILGHELAHHSALFLDDFGDSSEEIWFEEGMVEYISRKYFLTEEEYNREYEVNLALVQKLNSKYGVHPLEEFGSCTYEGDYASIFYEYWRSFLAIHQIVERYDGNAKEVFASYHRWAAEGRGNDLTYLVWGGKFMKKRLTGILSLIELTGSYWVLRYPLYSLHGMKEWPLILLIAGLLVISVSGILFATKFLPISTAAGYAAGFALGHWFQSDYGHSQNSLWIIWTCSFLASVLIGIGIELFAKNQEDTP